MVLLSPFAPHMTEELWQTLGHETSIFTANWPSYNAITANFRKSVTVVVQINGKIREQIEVAPDTEQKKIMEEIMSLEKIKKLLDDQKILKIIHVPNKLVNIVI
jgi:leucyl-tRNA synthetase